MDLVYVCRDGNNEELKYSIRSAVANLPHDNVWVVGGKPDWYVGNHIPVPQNSGAYENVRTSLRAIVDHTEVSQDFILMNDDFFIVKPVKDVNYFYSGTMDEKINNYMANKKSYGYITLLSNTKRELKRLGYEDILDYELHVPFPMNKEKLIPILEMKTLWRSLYGNIYAVGGSKMDDVKIYSKNKYDFDAKEYLDSEYIFLSTIDDSFDYILNSLLWDLFPNKSKYEA